MDEYKTLMEEEVQKSPHLNPTAVTEEVGVSDPVNVSLITSGGCLAMLNIVARTGGGGRYKIIATLRGNSTTCSLC